MTRELVLEALEQLPVFFTQDDLTSRLYQIRKYAPKPEEAYAEGIALREEIYAQLRSLLPALVQKYEIQTLEVFGSVAEGRAGRDSDIDILVKMGKVGWEIFGLANELELALAREVDITSEGTLEKPRTSDFIEKVRQKKVDMIYGPTASAR